MKKGQAGEIVLSKEKLWTISYADDIVLLAKRESGLKEMMEKFRKYLEKGLNLNPDKSKILIFEKGRGRMKKRVWKRQKKI